jgi:excisionase family DNA binding protein
MPYDVLTPSQVASYLQVGEDVVIREAEAGRLPGQKLGDQWRFLRLAITEWLRTGEQPEPEAKPKSSKERMLTAFGAWKDFGEDSEQVIAELSRVRKAASGKKR